MKPNPIRLRKTVLWIIPPLILITCGAILAAFYYQIGKMRDNVLWQIVDSASQQVETTFQAFFEPITSNLLVARNWGQTVAPDLDDTRTLNTQFIPMLEQLPRVSAMLVGTSEGQSYTLIRSRQGWETRVANAGGESGAMEWSRWNSPSDQAEHWSEAGSYDPRERPWYRGAVEAESDETPFWTEPYLLSTSSEKGLTASIRWHDNSNANVTYVAAFDVLLHEISAFTASLRLTENGDVFIVTDEGQVIGPPEDERFHNEAAIREAALSPVHTLGVAHTADAFDAWRTQDQGSTTPFRYTSERIAWWAAFRPLVLGNRTFWLGITLPEYELVHSIGAYRNVVPAAIVVLGLAALVGSILLVRKHGQQMDLLAREARRFVAAGDDLLETAVDDPARVRALIARGESERLEFKCTVRWNLHTDKPGKEIELAWLKGVVAFLNTDGGVILIGVDDDGAVLGLDRDKFANADKCLRHIGNLIGQHIGIEYAQYIRYSLVAVDGNGVAVIQCARSTTPAFLKAGKDEDFYVRAGPASQKLPTSQILGYIESRKTS